MGAAFLRRAGDARELLGLPAQDGVLVAFARLPARLLRGPTQPLPQAAADMIVVVANAEVPKDDFADAGRCPQLVGPAVGDRAACQNPFQLPQLANRQPGRPMRLRAGGQPGRRLLRLLAPAVHRRPIHAQKMSDGGRGFAGCKEFHATAATPFQFGWSSKWSTHNSFYARSCLVHCTRSCQ